MNEEPVHTHAGLSGIAVLAGQRARNRRIQIRVLEYDEWRIAAEFERDLLHGLDALCH